MQNFHRSWVHQGRFLSLKWWISVFFEKIVNIGDDSLCSSSWSRKSAMLNLTQLILQFSITIRCSIPSNYYHLLSIISPFIINLFCEKYYNFPQQSWGLSKNVISLTFWWRMQMVWECFSIMNHFRPFSTNRILNNGCRT